MQRRTAIANAIAVLLAGALGLEPRAYGFGDEADKSASGGTAFEVLISTIQEQTAAVFQKSNQNHNKSGISEVLLCTSKPTVLFAETVGSKSISYGLAFNVLSHITYCSRNNPCKAYVSCAQTDR